MKTVLIPTDFKLQSLNCIPQLTQRYYPQKLNILLVHMMNVTDSISELLMLSRRSTEYRQISDAFYQACTKIKQQNPDSINEIRIEFFYGNTTAVFKHFLEENNVDAIAALTDYDYELLNKHSVDPNLFISRSNIQVIEIDTMPISRAKAFAEYDEAYLTEQKV